MPITYNPIRRSRDDFMGEQSNQFFPSIDQGRTGLSPYVEGGYAASSRLAMDDLLAHRDQQNTQLAENYARRLEAEKRARLMPFTAAAEIASAKFHERQATLDEQNSPFIAEARRERAQLDAGQYAAERENLPAKATLEGLQTEDALANWEPTDAQQLKLMRITKDPRHLLNYEDLLASTPSSIPLRDRQNSAYQKALSLAQDERTVAAIESEIADEKNYPERRKALIKDEISPTSGRVMGSYIHPGADIAEVNRLVRKHENRKFDLQKSNYETRAAASLRRDRLRDLIIQIQAAEASMKPTADLHAQVQALINEDDPEIAAKKESEEAKARAAAAAAATPAPAAPPPPPSAKDEPKKEEAKDPRKEAIRSYFEPPKKK